MDLHGKLIVPAQKTMASQPGSGNSLAALKQSILSRKKDKSGGGGGNSGGSGSGNGLSQQTLTAIIQETVSELVDEATSLEDQAERYGMSGTRARARLQASWDVYAAKLLVAKFGWSILLSGSAELRPPNTRMKSSVIQDEEELTFDALYNAARTAELLATFSDPPTLPISLRLDLLEVALALSELAIKAATGALSDTPTCRIVQLANLADGHYNYAQSLRSLADELPDSWVAISAATAATKPVPLIVGRGLPRSASAGLSSPTKVAARNSKAQLFKLATDHLEKVFTYQQERLGLEAAERASFLASVAAGGAEEEAEEATDEMDSQISSTEGAEREAEVVEPLSTTSLIDTLLTIFETNTDLVSLILSAATPNTADAEHLVGVQTTVSAKIRELLASLPDQPQQLSKTKSLTLCEAQLGLLIPSQRAQSEQALASLIVDLEKSYPPDLDLLLPALADLADALLEDHLESRGVENGIPAPWNSPVDLLSRAHALRPRDVGITSSLGDARILLFTRSSNVRGTEVYAAPELEVFKASLNDYSKTLSVLGLELSRLITPTAQQQQQRNSALGRQPETNSNQVDPRALPLLERTLLLLQHVDPASFKTLLASSVYREHGGSARGFVKGSAMKEGEDATIWNWVGGASDWVRKELQLL